ncbi:helix-turn-helix domain-containing protein [Catellatospora paridis]|uniref:helix-turn-helix domain-containing protein n=1 Tax=Catellatospora paridis TaxID=1617086 RepID=UPI001E347AF5|nr:helix-turn-helix transcriptional regulator [Catellatospora paridis]
MPSNTSSSSQEALRALGLRLRELRQDAGLTGRDLCRATGWLPSKVSKIENGRQTPSHEDRVTVELVSGYLNLTQPHEVRMYAQAFAELSSIALYGPLAKELVQAAAGTYDSGF